MENKPTSKECIGDFFILNDNLTPCSKFDDKYLYHGKAIYEAFRIYDGLPIFLEEHLNRMDQSSRISDFPIWLNHDQMISRIKDLINNNPNRFGNIKLIFNINGDEQNFLAYLDNHSLPTKDEYQNGVRTGLYYAERENPNIKFVNMDLRIGTNKTIHDKGYYEVLLVSNDNKITECSRSNVFFIKNDIVFTPHVELVLPGINRDKVIEICDMLEVDMFENDINLDNLSEYEAAFITGTSPKAIQIKSIEETDYQCNLPLYTRISEMLDEMIMNDKEKIARIWHEGSA